jgi:hypothetical protein
MFAAFVVSSVKSMVSPSIQSDWTDKASEVRQG